MTLDQHLASLLLDFLSGNRTHEKLREELAALRWNVPIVGDGHRRSLVG